MTELHSEFQVFKGGLKVSNKRNRFPGCSSESGGGPQGAEGSLRKVTEVPRELGVLKELQVQITRSNGCPCDAWLSPGVGWRSSEKVADVLKGGMEITRGSREVPKELRVPREGGGGPVGWPRGPQSTSCWFEGPLVVGLMVPKGF